MKKYLLITKVAFQTVFEYRFNFFWKVFSRLMISSVLIIFWYFILEYNTSFEKVTPEYMIRYYIIMGFIFSLNLFDIFELSTTIREGDIVNIISKPLDHLMYWFFKNLPSKIIVFIVYIVIITLVSYFLDINILPTNLTMIPFSISLGLGIVGSFLIYYCIGLLTIWLKKVYSIYDLVKTFEGVLGGTYIPILLLPTFLKNLSKVLPLRYFSYLPVDISSQSVQNKDIMIGIIIEILWILILMLIYKIIWKKGFKDLEIVGI